MDRAEFIAALHKRPAREETRQLTRNGEMMSDDEAVRLEQLVDEHPDSSDARLRLVGYYTRRLAEPSARERRSQHVLWFLKNQPEAAVILSPYARLELDKSSYEEGKRILLNHLRRRKPSRTLFENAAYFMETFDKDKSKKLWEQAKQLPSHEP